MTVATTIAVDCMGGDKGPEVTVPAAVSFLAKEQDCKAILVGRQEQLMPLLGTRVLKEYSDRLRVLDAREEVEMHEPVASALRNKKKSSMQIAIDLVKSGEAQGALSAGNTGALMAISRFVLKTLSGIDRPAICTILPTIHGHVYMLDLGANVDCEAEHLLQFAEMGSLLVTSLEHRERPTVGLLNIGSEDIKGNEIVKRASTLLKESSLNFYGNVEGDDIFRGTTDIVVCDGFVGNVVLKSVEGVVHMLTDGIKEELSRSGFSKFFALGALPLLRRCKSRFDPRVYNGASLLGLNGTVFKSHGSADVFAFCGALTRVAEASRQHLVERIAKRMSSYSETVK